jgi:hypothetical protein
MSDKYPLPAYAVSMWVVGDNLMVAFPGTVSEKGHTIKLPASAGGLQAAITIMKDRARATDLRIGNKGTPTQYDLEAIGKFMIENAGYKEREARKASTAAEVAEATAFLEELGL